MISRGPPIFKKTGVVLSDSEAVFNLKAPPRPVSGEQAARTPEARQHLRAGQLHCRRRCWSLNQRSYQAPLPGVGVRLAGSVLGRFRGLSVMIHVEGVQAIAMDRQAEFRAIQFLKLV